MAVLARSLVEEFSHDGGTTAVVGMLQGRDPAAMLGELLTAGVRDVVACTPDSPRALPAEVVAEAARSLGMSVTVAGAPADAVGAAVVAAGPDDRVVVCGSLYVVADARRVLVPDAV
jgi:folylpolyglutamate synthase/dihydropteroate synthase